MREIKFRAWDKKDKVMREVCGIESLKISNHENRTKTIVRMQCSYYEDQKKIILSDFAENIDRIELMQYTGLKDKNGKEIYEGDIIGDIEDWSIVIWCDKCIGWQLAWYDIDIDKKTCHMCDGNFDITETFENNIADNDEEVIGNIYETPELLDKYARD